jgi:sugar fermentation stimulation protein A
LFCVQRADANVVEPARDIDPTYADTLRTAVNGGVEVLAYRAQVTTSAITLQTRLPFRLA